MNPLLMEIPLTESTPYILIDEAKGYIRFKGECYSENTVEFFKPITDWLTGYLAKNFRQLIFDCELEYFNSSTSKLLYNMLIAMDTRAAQAKGKVKITVNWIVDKDNDVIIECGEDFEDELENLEFVIKCF